MNRKEGKNLSGNRKMLLAAVTLTGLIIGICSCGGKTKNTQEQEKEGKLTVLLQTEDYQNRNTWKGENAEALYQETGLTLSLTSVDMSGDKQLEQYMVTGTLPDIMIFKGVNQAKVLLDAGLLMKWNEYEEQLENVFHEEVYWQAIKDSAEFMSDGEGNVLLMLLPACEQEHVQEDWLPYLRFLPYMGIGSPKVRTVEDYLDIVEEMKNKFPYTVNGQQAYGFSLSGEGDIYALEQVSELGYLYGMDMCMVTPLMETSPEAGTTVSIFREDSFYKRALHFYFEANQRGLLDPDSRSQTRKSLQEKYQSGSVMFGSSENLTKLYWTEISGLFSEEDKGDAYIPVLAEDMRIYCTEETALESNWYIAVNDLSANKEEICLFLNWLYDTETGNRFFCADSETVLTQKMQVAEEHPWKRVLKEAQVSNELEERIVYGGNEANRISLAPADLWEKMRAIGKINCQTSWEMIYAEDEETFEALWEKLCGEVVKLGMEEVEAFYQKTYEQAGKSK